MSTAVIVILIVSGLIIGGIISLRSSARTGMPAADVLERAAKRARELEAREKSPSAASDD